MSCPELVDLTSDDDLDKIEIKTIKLEHAGLSSKGKPDKTEVKPVKVEHAGLTNKNKLDKTEVKDVKVEHAGLTSKNKLDKAEVKPVKLELVDLSSDDELDKIEVKPVKTERVKIEQGVVGVRIKGLPKTPIVYKDQSKKEKLVNSFVDDTSTFSTSTMSPPLCRQFWKAGSYNDHDSNLSIKNGKNHLHVHPMFLHSNATSHKWSFGAIAELLDNAFDEIDNGATYVNIDRISNPRDGSSALLIQDDGGGLDPEGIRKCMSFGFTSKSTSAIGQYGNGFKASSMRLGADAIVFSRHVKKKRMTQSIGLLSYTFLTRTGLDRIVVPIMDYEFNTSTGKFEALHGKKRLISNLSILLKWSPYTTEVELLKQFDNVGAHGTKVIIYNLWLSDDGKLELDFDSDHEDIRISSEKNQEIRGWQHTHEQRHLANRLLYSLRTYLSILYLRVPTSFKMILRGKVVKLQNVTDDLMFPQYILYKPKCNKLKEAKVVTTIGFVKEAPKANIHGFCVYHNNRLILPYWKVVSNSDRIGRGVVGALETAFLQPTHNKQDFERTSLFQKLEIRLKDMTLEYWDNYCQLIGFQRKKKQWWPSQASSTLTPHSYDELKNLPSVARRKPASNSSYLSVGTENPPASASVLGSIDYHKANSSHFSVGTAKPLETDSSHLSVGTAKPLETDSTSINFGNWKEKGRRTTKKKPDRQVLLGENVPIVGREVQLKEDPPQDREIMDGINDNKELQTRCSAYEETAHKLMHETCKLATELASARMEYDRLMEEMKLLNRMETQIIANS